MSWGAGVRASAWEYWWHNAAHDRGGTLARQGQPDPHRKGSRVPGCGCAAFRVWWALAVPVTPASPPGSAWASGELTLPGVQEGTYPGHVRTDSQAPGIGVGGHVSCAGPSGKKPSPYCEA